MILIKRIKENLKIIKKRLIMIKHMKKKYNRNYKKIKI
jgi:hypothetical protein